MQAADRVIRNKADGTGRDRLRSDTTLQASRPLYALLVTSGEDMPEGQSAVGRLLAVHMYRGCLDLARVTKAQVQGREGVFARAMAGYLTWVAGRFDEIKATYPAKHHAFRTEVPSDGLHARTPGIIADLAIGWESVLVFAEEIGALMPWERETLWNEGWEALLAAAEAQKKYQQNADPVGRFLQLLAAGIASGQ